jgi:DNA-binding transcriptional LysR family regulator
MVVNDPDLLVSAALEGIGVIYELEEYVQPMLADGSLVSLLDDSVRPPMEGFFLYYPSRRQNPAALQALIEFFRKELRGSARAQASQQSDSDEP